MSIAPAKVFHWQVKVLTHAWTLDFIAKDRRERLASTVFHRFWNVRYAFLFHSQIYVAPSVDNLDVKKKHDPRLELEHDTVRYDVDKIAHLLQPRCFRTEWIYQFKKNWGLGNPHLKWLKFPLLTSYILDTLIQLLEHGRQSTPVFNQTTWCTQYSSCKHLFLTIIIT